VERTHGVAAAAVCADTVAALVSRLRLQFVLLLTKTRPDFLTAPPALLPAPLPPVSVVFRVPGFAAATAADNGGSTTDYVGGHGGWSEDAAAAAAAVGASGWVRHWESRVFTAAKERLALSRAPADGTHVPAQAAVQTKTSVALAASAASAASAAAAAAAAPAAGSAAGTAVDVRTRSSAALVSAFARRCGVGFTEYCASVLALKRAVDRYSRLLSAKIGDVLAGHAEDPAPWPLAPVEVEDALLRCLYNDCEDGNDGNGDGGSSGGSDDDHDDE
jgi:hypothetical protein